MESSQVIRFTVTFAMGVPASVVTTPESAPVSTAATDTSALGLAVGGDALGEDCTLGSEVGVGVVSDSCGVGVGWTLGGSLGAGIGAGDDGGSGTASVASAGVSEGSGVAQPAVEAPDGAVADATPTDDDEGATLV